MRVDRSYRRDLPLHLDHLHQECKGVETSGEAGERMTVDLTQLQDLRQVIGRRRNSFRIDLYERHI